MAKNRKQVVLNGQTYERTSGKSGRYVNINNPDDSISRRQAEKSELAKAGYKSFEQKVKARKAAGIPKGFRRITYKSVPNTLYYRKRAQNIADLKEELLLIPNNYLVIVKTFGKYTRDNKTGLSLLEAGHTLKAWRVNKIGYATADYYLKFGDFLKQRRQFQKEGYLISEYEIVISPKPN